MSNRNRRILRFVVGLAAIAIGLVLIYFEFTAESRSYRQILGTLVGLMNITMGVYAIVRVLQKRNY